MIPAPSSVARCLIYLGATVAVIGVLVGCTPAAVQPAVTETPSTALPTSEPTPQGPQLMPEGSAQDNLALFSAVVGSVWAGEGRDSGQVYIDALTDAGFDRSAMQVTADMTTVGNPVDTLLFSVRWDEAECLVGQVGPSTGDPVTAVMPVLEQDRCLVGSTRPIDVVG